MHRFMLLLALLGVGCAAPRQYFRPAERHHGHTLQGYPEALYTLVGAKGQFGEAKLWSRGSYYGRNGETLIQVAVELHNTSGDPLTLHAADVRLESVDTELGPINELPARAARDRTVPAGALGQSGFEFELPARLAPGEIGGFVLRWKVEGGGQSYSQRTPFVVEYRRRYYASPYGYGYPYYYSCEPLDPLCPYRFGYPYYGPPVPSPYYYPPTVVAPPPPPPSGGIIVRPRR